MSSVNKHLKKVGTTRQKPQILNTRSEEFANKGTWLILKMAVSKINTKKLMFYQNIVKFRKNKAEFAIGKKI